ncbi:MAG: peptidoglycan bridge formation glycyltransferase FemA/FemB family protein [Paludibacteraceae bacterium]
MQIVSLSSSLYPAFYQLVQQTVWGNPMLPEHYNDSLWGDILLQDSQVVGGWIGTLRGNHPLTRWLTKSVYFDAYPIFQTQVLEQNCLASLIEAVKQHAEKERIVMLNLTHWVRGNCDLPLETQSVCATFYYDLTLTTEDLYSRLDRLKKRTIKKAESNPLDVQFYAGRDALPYISEFQALREATQARAIERNKDASMLLKSDSFFERLFLTQKTTLSVVRLQGKMVAAATFIESGQTVYAHMSGSDAEANRTTGSGTYYYWKAIDYFRQKGLRQFDFGGCPVNPDEHDPAWGVFVFKRGFGGIYAESREGRMVINPKRYAILEFLLSQRKLLRIVSRKM